MKTADLQLAARAAGLKTVLVEEHKHAVWIDTKDGVRVFDPKNNDTDTALLETIGIDICWFADGVSAIPGEPDASANEKFVHHQGDKLAAKRAAVFNAAVKVGRLIV